MNDKQIIIAGLVIALVVLTSPIWYSLAAGPGDKPQLAKPRGDACVRDVEYMRGHHMDILEGWRIEVVREENTEKDESGYEKSLTKTCLAECHVTADTGQEGFCGECHKYADVDPTCWDCHVGNPKPKGE